MENGYDKIIKKIKSNNDYFFKYPKNIKEYRNIKLTHWSYYENWDPYRNYLVAKKAGVNILAYRCDISSKKIFIDKKLKIIND